MIARCLSQNQLYAKGSAEMEFYMKNLREKRPRYIWRAIVLPVIILAGMLYLFAFGINKFDAVNREQNRTLIEMNIKKAAIQCYANEGRFPSDVTYLQDNYYLVIDEEKYVIFYECMGSNIMPEIDVFEK